MKIAIVLLGLVVLVTAKPPKSGGEGKSGGSGGSGDEEGMKKLATMIEFAQLGGKCEIYDFFKTLMAEKTEKRAEEEEGVYILEEACPHIKTFVSNWKTADEADREAMEEAIQDSFFLVQCSNLIAEAQNLQYMGFNQEGSDLKSDMLEAAGPLFEFCKAEFGAAEEEEKKLEEAMDKGENQSIERRILNLLKQLNKKSLA